MEQTASRAKSARRGAAKNVGQIPRSVATVDRRITSPPQKLIDGFVRFRARHFDRDDSLLQQLVAQGQTPTTLVVACCDSHVDPALVLDCAPGDLFVIRNVANLVPPSEGRIWHHGTSAALEFGVRNLGVEHIIVLGHAHCDGIQALAKTGAYIIRIPL